MDEATQPEAQPAPRRGPGGVAPYGEVTPEDARQLLIDNGAMRLYVERLERRVVALEAELAAKPGGP